VPESRRPDDDAVQLALSTIDAGDVDRLLSVDRRHASTPHHLVARVMDCVLLVSQRRTDVMPRHHTISWRASWTASCWCSSGEQTTCLDTAPSRGARHGLRPGRVPSGGQTTCLDTAPSSGARHGLRPAGVPAENRRHASTPHHLVARVMDCVLLVFQRRTDDMPRHRTISWRAPWTASCWCSSGGQTTCLDTAPSRGARHGLRPARVPATAQRADVGRRPTIY